jgi:high-affinity Fe2+/Pb2+ permease
MKKMIGYFSLVTGRLGVLFVAGGLFVMAADYLHSQNHEDQSDAATRVTQCMRDGACEAS